MQRRALGKGIRSLIPEELLTEEASTGYLELPIDQIYPGYYQPRKDFNDIGLKELAESIKKKGIIQPIIVQKKDINVYNLIAGERRWRAAEMAGLKSIPALIKDIAEDEILETALIENIQREDLNPVELAEAYKRLIDEYNLTQEDVSVRVDKDRSSITNYIRLLRLPNEIKMEIGSGKLSMGHARALLSLDNVNDQIMLKDEIVKKGLSVRSVEYIVKSRKGSKKEIKEIYDNTDLFVKDAEDKIKNRLGANVLIRKGKKKGKIEIQFFSDEDLERLVELLIDK